MIILFLFMLFASLEEKMVDAIASEDYEFVESVLKSKQVSPTSMVYGKPLIIHAVIHNKPEMVLLLAEYGAMRVDPLCEDGKDVFDYAKEYESTLALAQIIVIRA